MMLVEGRIRFAEGCKTNIGNQELELAQFRRFHSRVSSVIYDLGYEEGLCTWTRSKKGL